jgi:hypothetical protein
MCGARTNRRGIRSGGESLTIMMIVVSPDLVPLPPPTQKRT